MERDDAIVKAAWLLSGALEDADRARGHLYAFRQLTGAVRLAPRRLPPAS